MHPLRLFRMALFGSLLPLLTACNGMFDGIYDDPSGDAVRLTNGQLYMDATDWNNWYYIDFDSLEHLARTGDSLALLRAQTHFTPYPVPRSLTAGKVAGGDSTGMYTYWFDVFGKGLSNNRLREFHATDRQPEPASWDIAIHRNNVRTNGGAVLETNYTSLDDLPASSASFSGAPFTPDSWNETDVWVDRSEILDEYIGCQGIRVNTVLSSWLRVDIPPIPPKFTLNNHVFIVRLRSGRMLALQLSNYMNQEGTKCWLTINYKYPY